MQLHGPAEGAFTWLYRGIIVGTLSLKYSYCVAVQPTFCPSGRGARVSGSTTLTCVPGMGRPTVPRTFSLCGKDLRQASTGDVSERPQPFSTGSDSTFTEQSRQYLHIEQGMSQ